MPDGLNTIKRITNKSKETACALCGAQLGFISHTLQTGEVICADCCMLFKRQKGPFASPRQYTLAEVRFSITGGLCAQPRQTSEPTGRNCTPDGGTIIAQYCGSCGRQNTPEGDFCLDCGARLDPANTTVAVESRHSRGLAYVGTLVASIPTAALWFAIGVLLTMTVFLAIFGIPIMFAAILAPIIFPIIAALLPNRTISLVGNCPWCQSRMRSFPQSANTEPRGITCPVCQNRVVLRDNRFIRV